MRQRFDERRKKHDVFEEGAMDVIRPHTTRRHLPDRFISLHDEICAFDAKTTVFVEDNSHDEYFRVQTDDDIPVFIVYLDKEEVLAGWIDDLTWNGPRPPSKNSTCGDPYYIISGGVPLVEWLKIHE